MKKEIEVIGFDDAPFNRSDRECILIGTYMRGSCIIDGIYFRKFEKDGMDITKKIIEVVKDRHYPKIKAVFLYGITFGGFNIADIYEINEKTEKPVIVVIDKKPNIEKMFSAIEKHFNDSEERISLIKSFPKPEKLNDIYVQYVGTDKNFVKKVIEITKLKSKIPECLRISHLIGRGFLDIKK
ncbi:protein of unknown function DUF99 [Methanocaldococcus vulcanius M7]|uniref:UPF0215 protein Metvu_0388 n=1 Tax=Methanocaldococcus vulcanius (strain ATCC 700851 / DSM 12094 / M7) TaxID=579137 RepID=C9RF99_METVM|nr:DUF99 family protein [Methanocaldococcus vulcanius]ACX72251.1 protein of unknown function DUF99 [Methanocaldococcus vulcanius M7]